MNGYDQQQSHKADILLEVLRNNHASESEGEQGKALDRDGGG